jgi:hypothetical protein
MLTRRFCVLAACYCIAMLSVGMLFDSGAAMALAMGTTHVVSMGIYYRWLTPGSSNAQVTGDEAALQLEAAQEVDAIAPTQDTAPVATRKERDRWLHREFDALSRKRALRRAEERLGSYERRCVDEARREREKVAKRRDAEAFWTGETRPKMTAASLVSQYLEELYLLDRGGFVKAVGWAGARNTAWLEFCEKNDDYGKVYLLPDPEGGTLRRVWATDPSRADEIAGAMVLVADGRLPAWPVPVDAETRAKCMAAGDYYPEKMAV